MGGVNSCCKKPEETLTDQDLYKVPYNVDIFDQIPSDEDPEENKQQNDLIQPYEYQNNYEDPYKCLEQKPAVLRGAVPRNLNQNNNYDDYDYKPNEEIPKLRGEPVILSQPYQEPERLRAQQPPKQNEYDFNKIHATVKRIQKEPNIYSSSMNEIPVFQPQPEQVPLDEKPLFKEIPEDEQQPVAPDLDQILRDWDNQYGPYEPIPNIYDPNGWRQEYDPNNEFFNWDKGNTNYTQRTLLNPNEIYEGEMNPNGEKHGFGTSITTQGLKQGTWKNGQFSGWNVESQRGNGVLRYGRFENGVMNGKGTIKDPRKEFVGDIENDFKIKGTEIDNKAKSRYVGEFRNNLREGKGVYECATSAGSTYDYKYEGEFLQGKSTGKGQITWGNGDFYEGDVVQGKMDGKGICKYNNGRVYEGEFRNGKKEGHGKYTLQDGKVFEGNFVNGKEDGEGIMTFPDGRVFKGLYQSGKLKQTLQPLN